MPGCPGTISWAELPKADDQGTEFSVTAIVRLRVSNEASRPNWSRNQGPVAKSGQDPNRTVMIEARKRRRKSRTELTRAELSKVRVYRISGYVHV